MKRISEIVNSRPHNTREFALDAAPALAMSSLSTRVRNEVPNAFASADMMR